MSVNKAKGKYPAAPLVALACVVAVFAVAGVYLGMAKSDYYAQVTVLEGDVAAMDGVSIKMTATCDWHCQYELLVTPGGSETIRYRYGDATQQRSDDYQTYHYQSLEQDLNPDPSNVLREEPERFIASYETDNEIHYEYEQRLWLKQVPLSVQLDRYDESVRRYLSVTIHTDLWYVYPDGVPVVRYREEYVNKDDPDQKTHLNYDYIQLEMASGHLGNVRAEFLLINGTTYYITATDASFTGSAGIYRIEEFVSYRDGARRQGELVASIGLEDGRIQVREMKQAGDLLAARYVSRQATAMCPACCCLTRNRARLSTHTVRARP